MAIQFKQKCKRCNTNYVIASNRSKFIVCAECQKKEYSQEVTDPEMKKFFDIPEEFYVNNYFLRDIKIKYLKYGNLSENQISAFQRAVKEMEEKKNNPTPPPVEEENI